jgi:hypothetical protein
MAKTNDALIVKSRSTNTSLLVDKKHALFVSVR